ncbi:MAG: DUF86 domain-containing protein [Bacteroidia bacterium]|nr:DUF86 domain-containing protein [Bacteroidia bacterium]
MRGRLPDKVRVQHILDAIAEVEKYITDISLEVFLENSEKRYATIKQIEIIGEACNNITSELQEVHHEIQWRLIRGFRNISIHEYFGVNFHIVWEIATNDLPVLKEQFNTVLKDLD